MATLSVDNVLPETSGVAENLNLGTTGDSVSVAGTIKTNKIADAGGNNIVTSDGSGNLTVNAGMKGNIALLRTETASNTAEIAFNSTYLTSTYKCYWITFTGIRPASDGVTFHFQVSINNGSAYGITGTAAFWEGYKSSGSYGVGLNVNGMRNNSTGYQYLAYNLGNVANENCSGELHLFNPSRITLNKQYYADFTSNSNNSTMQRTMSAGWFATASAVNAINFKMSSGNIAEGIIRLYGLG